MDDATPQAKHLVLVGGGHAHVHVLKMFGMERMEGVRITLITRDVETPYSGMLPGHVAGFYTREECHIDLSRLASFCGAALMHANAVGLDLERKEVRVRALDGSARPPVSYDILSIDVGITPKTSSAAGAESDLEEKLSRLGTPVKPIDGFARRWDALREKVAAHAGPSPLELVVVGGGAGGVELALSMHHRVQADLAAAGRSADAVRFSIATRGRAILKQHNRRVQAAFRRVLRDKGIALRLGAEVVGIEEAGPGKGGAGADRPRRQDGGL